MRGTMVARRWVVRRLVAMATTMKLPVSMVIIVEAVGLKALVMATPVVVTLMVAMVG